jgi:hypothetical protein
MSEKTIHINMQSAIFSKLKQIKLFGFGLFSLVGLLLDLGAFLSFIYLGFSVQISNIVAGGIGVTFVFFSSAKNIFLHDSEFLFVKFLVYVIWNCFRIYFLTVVIVFLTDSLYLAPVLSKILILPFSLYMNFFFMNILMTSRIKFY